VQGPARDGKQAGWKSFGALPFTKHSSSSSSACDHSLSARLPRLPPSLHLHPPPSPQQATPPLTQRVPAAVPAAAAAAPRPRLPPLPRQLHARQQLLRHKQRHPVVQQVVQQATRAQRRQQVPGFLAGVIGQGAQVGAACC
jgi:hypothetical protein